MQKPMQLETTSDSLRHLKGHFRLIGIKIFNIRNIW